MPKFLLALILFVLSLPGFSEEGTAQTLQPLNQYTGKVTIQGAPTAPAVQDVPPPPPALNEDAAVNELQQIRETQIKKAQAIETATKPLAAPALNPLEEIQKLGHKQRTAAVLLDDKVLAIIQKTLKEGVMRNRPAEEIRALIQEKAKGSFLEGVIRRFPKILDIFVGVMKDEKALPGLIGILIRRDDLKTYGYICLGLFLFGMFVKHRIIKPKWKFFKRFRYSVTVSLIISAITCTLFYNFFKDEISPTLAVISKNL